MTAAYPGLAAVPAGSGTAAGTREAEVSGRAAEVSGSAVQAADPAGPLRVYEAALHRACGSVPTALCFVTDCGITRTVDVAARDPAGVGTARSA